MTIEFFRPWIAGALVASLLALTGCAADKADPANIDRRSVERWNYLIAHEAEKAYDYLSPGFRSTKTREDYAAAMNNRPLQWKAVKFNSKTCEEDRCTVLLDITYEVKLPLATGKTTESTSTQKETWILVDGEWCLLPK